MLIKRIIQVVIVSAMCLVACNNPEEINSEAATKDLLTNSKVKKMNSYVSMFEIPATDISRAIHFYQAVLDLKIEKMDVEGMQMGILPYEEQVVTGILIQSDGYKPSAEGVTMYLNAGEDLQVVLDRVVENGGQIIVPKTAHADDSGYFAIFLDSEGNKMGLNSPN